MEPIVIFCKSYLPDLHRLIHLLESINIYNVQKIPVFISVPQKEQYFFKTKLREFDVTIISDEEITNDLIEKPINEFNYIAYWKSYSMVHPSVWQITVHYLGKPVRA